jgi:flagellar biosynthesis chaperone FliJ
MSNKKSIPSNKFTHPDSCYSFIARKNTEEKLLEIYFPPDVKIAADFQDWLNKNNYERSQDNLQLFTSELNNTTKGSLEKILSLAKKNGAFEIQPDVEFDSLSDRTIKSSNKDLASVVAEKVNDLVEEKLQDILAKTATNQKKLDQYEEKIARYEQQLKEQEQQLNQLQKQLTEKVQEINNFKSLFGENIKTPSPFFNLQQEQEENTIHLNSPFNLSDTEITDLNDYDDTEYNRNISPFEEKNKANDLDNIDLNKLDDLQEQKIAKKVYDHLPDLESALDNLDLNQLDEIVKPTSSNNGRS